MSSVLKSGVVLVTFILLSLASLAHAITPEPAPPDSRTHTHPLHGLDAQLMKAVDDGDEVRARALVKEGASIKALGGEAIITASETRALYPDRKAHSLSLLSWLIAGGPDVNYSSDAGYTPLMWAAFTGSADAARILIEHGARVNSHDKDGNTALMIAARVRCWEQGDMCFPKVARVLISDGAHLNETNSGGDTALLIVANAAAVTATIDEYSPHEYAAGELSNAREYAQLLLEAGAKFDISDVDGTTALRAACNAWGSCKPWLAALLLDRGADPNADVNGDSLLTMVAQVDDYNANAPEKLDDDAAATAAALIRHGAEVNVQDVVGRTPLMYACNSTFLDRSVLICKRRLANLLLEHGASVNAVDDEGNSALMYLAGITSTAAINSADVPIAEALFARGANRGLKNRAGETALDIARKNKLKRLAKVLEGKP